MTPQDPMDDGNSPSSSQRLSDLVGGRYQIVSRLGVGGMGVVYKATDLQLRRSVAIKALEERRLQLPGAHGRLKTEALAAASLDHPYICKVYELIETPAETFIVMEYIEGETLASMLKRGVLPLQQTLQLGREIAEGLGNAHARGLVHRDVKPSNVMVTPHGHVKLLDFGVAGADVESTPKDVTRTLSPQVTMHAGTPQYMAPEQATGQPITSRADLFSLGVVLYECLTGKLPFSGTTTFDYVRHVMQSDRALPREIAGGSTAIRRGRRDGAAAARGFDDRACRRAADRAPGSGGTALEDDRARGRGHRHDRRGLAVRLAVSRA
jgi:serine/threonine protein kinase